MGWEKQVLKEGDAHTYPKTGQKVTCHFVLYLQNGKKVDASRDRDVPFVFNIGK